MNHIVRRTSFVALAFVSTSSLCLAQESEDAAQEAQPKMNLSVAPPEAPVQRTDYVHEGFYFRAGVGPGFMSTSVTDKASDAKSSETSFSLGSELLLGASPSPGMTFGGGGLVDLGLGSDVATAFVVGPFFDAHPNDKGGWHLGGMVGFAGTSLGSGSSLLMGGGGSLFAGHDIWATPEWSVGLGTRLTGSRVGNEDFSATNVSLHFMISILNH